MWYKNICSASFSFVTIHACDRRTDRRTDGLTDRITTPKTALAYARAVIKNMFSEMFLLSYLHHCALITNPKEITVNNFVSTFDNADQMASVPSDATTVNQSNRIEIAFSRIAQL